MSRRVRMRNRLMRRKAMRKQMRLWRTAQAKMRAMTALHSVQMPLERYDRNGDEIKPGMYLVTDEGDKMYVFSLPSLYIVADQGSREANLAYAAKCIRTGRGEFYPRDFLILDSWEIKK